MTFSLITFYKRLQATLISDKVKRQVEVGIIRIAIFAFLLHLSLIGLLELHWIQVEDATKLLSSPITAIYTPFSFILFYEVYLLIFYLPRSTSIYIAKQYEIISLIMIRRAMKDLSEIDLETNWFRVQSNVQFTSDVLAALILFYLIFHFYQLNQKKTPSVRTQEKMSSVARFIRLKVMLSLALLPVFIVLAIKNLTHWVIQVFFMAERVTNTIPDINKIFFEEFFTILILVDVLILLFSFLNSDKFYKVMRNSGFIISTVLIKLSFATEGVLNSILVVAAVLFGVAILWIHNRFERIETN